MGDHRKMIKVIVMVMVLKMEVHLITMVIIFLKKYIII